MRRAKSEALDCQHKSREGSMKKVSGWKTPKCLGKCEFHKVGGLRRVERGCEGQWSVTMEDFKYSADGYGLKVEGNRASSDYVQTDDAKM